jgi:DNA-binding MarR family transcriptional regulator
LRRECLGHVSDLLFPVDLELLRRDAGGMCLPQVMQIRFMRNVLLAMIADVNIISNATNEWEAKTMKSEDFALSEFLPYRMAVLSARMSRLISTVYEERFGISMPEWRVIVHLGRCEKVSVREIHNCVNLEKPRVSRAVNRLQKAGLVQKAPSTQDQRLVEIALTDKGQKVLNEIIPEALGFEAQMLANFSEEEHAQLVSLMERLHTEIDKDDRAPRRSRMDTEPGDPKIDS